MRGFQIVASNDFRTLDVWTQPVCRPKSSGKRRKLVTNPRVVDDTRIARMKPLITPVIRVVDLLLIDTMMAQDDSTRREITDIITEWGRINFNRCFDGSAGEPPCRRGSHNL